MFVPSSISFGLSTNLAVAIISRLLCGLINGNAGVVRSYLREITDETNQARAYSIRSGMSPPHFLVLPCVSISKDSFLLLLL